jgi:hypothetical protein
MPAQFIEAWEPTDYIGTCIDLRPDDLVNPAPTKINSLALDVIEPVCTRLVATRFLRRAWDLIEVRVRDGVLSEKEAQLSRMFLDVTRAVKSQLQKADWTPP